MVRHRALTDTQHLCLFMLLDGTNLINLFINKRWVIESSVFKRQRHRKRFKPWWREGRQRQRVPKQDHKETDADHRDAPQLWRATETPNNYRETQSDSVGLCSCFVAVSALQSGCLGLVITEVHCSHWCFVFSDSFHLSCHLKSHVCLVFSNKVLQWVFLYDHMIWCCW